MDRTLPELVLEPIGAADHLIIGALVGELGDGKMGLGMGADGDQLIGGQGTDLVPTHHQLCGSRQTCPCRSYRPVRAPRGADSPRRPCAATIDLLEGPDFLRPVAVSSRQRAFAA